jgi:hypothetical protein
MSDKIPDPDFDPDAFISVEAEEDVFVESLDMVDEDTAEKKDES